MKREKFTVQPSRQGGWDLQDSGGGKTPFNTKADAVERGRELARGSKSPSQLIIKKGDGTIQTEHTYQKDPRKYPS